ncbi:hypothetical protein GCM10020331_064600 [Ectobacillus funiculus]
MIPGEYRLQAEPIVCNAGKKGQTVSVLNRGDRPVQVGSHFHFYEVNAALSFEREKGVWHALKHSGRDSCSL